MSTVFESKLIELFNHFVPISKVDANINISEIIAATRNELASITDINNESSHLNLLRTIAAKQLYMKLPTQIENSNSVAEQLILRLKSDFFSILKRNKVSQYNDASEFLYIIASKFYFLKIADKLIDCKLISDNAIDTIAVKLLLPQSYGEYKVQSARQSIRNSYKQYYGIITLSTPVVLRSEYLQQSTEMIVELLKDFVFDSLYTSVVCAFHQHVLEYREQFASVKNFVTSGISFDKVVDIKETLTKAWTLGEIQPPETTGIDIPKESDIHKDCGTSWDYIGYIFFAISMIILAVFCKLLLYPQQYNNDLIN